MIKKTKLVLFTSLIALAACSCSTQQNESTPSSVSDNSSDTSENGSSSTPPQIDVDSVSFDKSEMIIQKDQIGTINATVLPTNATNKSLMWTSSNNEVATVNNGTVNPVGVGHTTITATSNNNKTATCEVTVSSQWTLYFNQTDLEKKLGDSAIDLKDFVTFNGDKTELSFSSSTDVCSVSGSTLSFEKEGNAVITCNYAPDELTTTMNIEVVDIKPASVSLSETELVLDKGSSRSLVATITPSNARDKTITWTSDNPSVATVSSDGYVSAVSEGGASITATTYNGFTATCSVSVEEPEAFDFPALNTFETENCYQSSASNKYMYQAKSGNHEIDVYMKQSGTIDIGAGGAKDYTKSHVALTVFDSSFGGGAVNGTDFTLFANGEFLVSNTNQLLNVKFRANQLDANNIEYKLIITTKNAVSDNTFVKFYSHDVASSTAYNDDDYVCYFNNNTSYHTTLPEKLSVKDSICFYNKDNYPTPLQYATVAPNHYGYQMSAQKEGLYIYAYQKAPDKFDTFDDATKWTNVSHIEMQLYHHGLGYGFNGSYLAFWQDGHTYYSNIGDVPTNPQLKDLSFHVNITGNPGDYLIEYFIFLKFNNNLENPTDGPYAYAKLRFYDVSAGVNRYDDYDIVEYRDNRYIHTTNGNSLIVHNAIAGIDNPFETSYANNKLAMFNTYGKSRDNLTLFIGDSYFEPEGWWTPFYTSATDGFVGKNAASSAIGGTTIAQWLTWDKALIRPFADSNGNIKNIVIHLGYNDINGTLATDEQLAQMFQWLAESIHSKYPYAKLFFVGVGRSAWFEYSTRWINGVEVLKADSASGLDYRVWLMSQSLDYLTFIDTNQIYDTIKANEGVDIEGIFKDGTHPKNEYYRYFIQAIENAGCQIDNI